VAVKCCEKGAELLAHRLRSPFGEIDLVFQAHGRIQLVEVKSLGPRAIIDGRISRRQRYRLSNCVQWAQEKWRAPTHMHLALVNKHGIIRWIPDFLS
jgi:Holliday junction resolvase-like predicted endonuclease